MKFKEFLIGYGVALSTKSQESQNEILAFLSVFCETHRETVNGWFYGKHFPNGITFIKLQEALVGAGYSIDEYEALSPTMKQCAQYLAHGVIDLDVTAKMLGYHRRDGFLRLFTGNRRAGAERMRQIQRICNEQAANDGLSREQFSILQIQLVESAISSEKSEANENVSSLANALLGLGMLIKHLTPELLALLNGTPEERRAFRETMENGKFFELSNDVYQLAERLGALCSETAFRENQAKERKVAL
jgi:hypothetical protein